MDIFNGALFKGIWAWVSGKDSFDRKECWQKVASAIGEEM